jgi:hypothetical protein
MDDETAQVVTKLVIELATLLLSWALGRWLRRK